MEPSAAPRPACPQCGRPVEGADGAVNFCPGCGQDLRPAALSTPAPAALVGTVVADRYRLLSVLGQGGMGTVYKAEHIRMGKALALKVLRGAFAREEGAVERFLSEARIVSRLSHPHTIAVFDFGELDDGDGFYLAMEYVSGRDLAALLRQEERLGEARAVELGQQILGSLAEAHDAGVIHRDVKPANVMLRQTRGGEDWVKVLDFGIATLRDEPEAPGAEAAIVGTPAYLSPEQARGEPLDARADLYAVGALLYEVLAGRPPFLGPRPIDVVRAHLGEAPPPLLEVAPWVTPALAALVHRALEKRRERRWGSADEMRQALLALAPARGPAASGEAAGPTSTKITGPLEIASRDDFRAFERRLARLRWSRRLAPAGAALLLGLAGLAAWGWPEVHAVLRARLPAVAALVPAALRPAERFDGEEHEPNNTPQQANLLPLPPGPDGTPGGGLAVIRGHLGAKISDSSGDVDVFRVEVPPGAAGRVLVAEWSGEREGEGIRGLDVVLTLNRQRADGSGRSSAPLVASVDHGGPGRPERLQAAVEAGTYYLAVREKHGAADGPVEKPTDWYRLTVRLAPAEPGQEVEPNDAPDDTSARSQSYRDWRAVAERNPVGGGGLLRGDLSGSDADVLALTVTGAGEAPEALAVVPEATLAVSAETWRPDVADLGPPPGADRIRFERPREGAPGEVLVLDLGGAAVPGAPVLVRLRAAAGEGRWAVLGLGAGPASGSALLSLAEELRAAGRGEQALALCAAFARRLPHSAARTEALLWAGRLADEAWPRVVPLGEPCPAAEVVSRVEAWLEAHPGSALAAEAGRWRARALEAEAWAGGKGAAAARGKALAAWRALAGASGSVAAEAKARLEALKAGRGPGGARAVPACP